MYLAVLIKGPQPKPTIESFETIEDARLFVAGRVGEEWTIIDESGREVE